MGEAGHFVFSLSGGYYGSHLSDDELPLKERGQSHVTYFFYFGILRKDKGIDTSLLFLYRSAISSTIQWMMNDSRMVLDQGQVIIVKYNISLIKQQI